MEFTNPERSSSIAFRPNGVYTGKVVAIDNASNTVSVILPRVSARSARSNCKVLTGVMPAIGDQVGCVFAENKHQNYL